MAKFELEPYIHPDSEYKEEFVAIAGKIYRFTPENTKLNFFDDGDGDFDNIVHIYSEQDDKKLAIVMFIDEIEERDPKFIDRLIDKDYPVINNSQLDELTIDAYSRWAARDLDSGIPVDLDE